MKNLLRYNIRRVKSQLKEARRRKLSAAYYRDIEMNNTGDYHSLHAFDFYKCIFIHIPKTAGLAISKSLFGNLGPTHKNYDWFCKNWGSSTVNSYYKFTFVRNPWDRLYSAYTFLKKGGINEDDAAFSKTYLTSIPNFESFVMDWFSIEKLEFYHHFIPQYKFITSIEKPDKIMVDYVGRFEIIDIGFAHICEVLGMQGRVLQKVNANNAAESYKDVYTSGMINKVAHLYEEDIRLFNYSFYEK